jgi:hypothetical protein
MPRLQPLPFDALPAALRIVIEQARYYTGFVANDALTMAHEPAILRAARSRPRDGTVVITTGATDRPATLSAAYAGLRQRPDSP